jgi:hypothetical protein
MSNYLLVKEVINVMNVEELSKEFNEKFSEGSNVSEEEFKLMVGKYNSDCSDDYYNNIPEWMSDNWVIVKPSKASGKSGATNLTRWTRYSYLPFHTP